MEAKLTITLDAATLPALAAQVAELHAALVAQRAAACLVDAEPCLPAGAFCAACGRRRGLCKASCPTMTTTTEEAPMTTTTEEAPMTTIESGDKLSNSGYHRAGKGKWWWLRCDTTDAKIQIGSHRGDRYLEIAVPTTDLPAGNYTLGVGRGKDAIRETYAMTEHGEWIER